MKKMLAILCEIIVDNNFISNNSGGKYKIERICKIADNNKNENEASLIKANNIFTRSSSRTLGKVFFHSVSRLNRVARMKLTKIKSLNTKSNKELPNQITTWDQNNQ